MGANIKTKQIHKVSEFICENCDEWFLVSTLYHNVFKYCPNCGKKSYLNDDTIKIKVVYDKEKKDNKTLDI